MRRVLCTLASCVVMAVGGGPVAAQTTGEAGSEDAETSSDSEASFDQLVRQAGEAYQAERYEASAELFERAYEVKQVPNLLYNIGRSHEQVGEFEAAIRYYEQFVNEPEVDIEARRDALDRMKTLREIVEMRDQKDGQGERPDADRPDEPNAGQREALVDPTSEQPKSEPSTEPNLTYGWAFTAAGIAAMGGGGVFAFLASDDHQSLLDARTRREARTAANRGRRRAFVADGMFIGGAALTTVGLALFIWPPRRQVAPEDGERARVRAWPSFGAGGGGLTISAEF